MELRRLSRDEENLLEVLVTRANITNLPIDWKTNLFVHPMDNGGMGSLRLFPNCLSNDNRTFGKRVSEYQFFDEDGVAVIVSLNLDSSGDLFELDIWKTDFSALIRIPEKL